MDWSSKLASQTRLPPSPDLRPSAYTDDDVSSDLFSLNEEPAASRLSSVAHYSSLAPVALASSSNVPAAYSESPPSDSRIFSTNGASAASKRALGAIAGPKGVALLDWDKPHIPILVLSNTTNNSPGSGIVSLEFSTPPRYLAQCRRQSVVVWDVSGHASSPLCGRLTGESEPFTDMSWQPEHSNIVTITSQTAALWDIRQSAASNTPTLRLPSCLTTTPYQQVCCADDHIVGLLDAAGMLRLLDLRMTGYWLTNWQAHHHGGIGLDTMKTASSDSAAADKWVTWGLDDASASAVAKVWSTSKSTPDVSTVGGSASHLSDDYWSMGTPPRSDRPVLWHHLVGHCTLPNMSCARVIDDHVVLVGIEEGSAAWRAEAFYVRDRLQSVASWGAGEGYDKGVLQTAIGSEWEKLGLLQAVQIGLVQSKSGANVVLYSLTEEGYLLGHNIPEIDLSSSLSKNSNETDKDRKPSSDTGQLQDTNPKVSNTRVYPETQEIVVNDAARLWGTPVDRDRLVDSVQVPKSATQTAKIAQVAPDSGLLPFDMDIPFVYTLGNGNMVASTLQSGNGTGNGVGTDRIGSPFNPNVILDAESAIKENIDTSRIPCPRICGASFGPGIGGLAIFHNGGVKQMWNWYGERNESTHILPVPRMVGQDHDEPQEVVGAAIFPRTYQDLDSMKSAAKDAQWGDQDSSGVSSDSYQMTGEQFYEDDSYGSLDSHDAETPERERGSDAHSRFSDSQRGMQNSNTTLDISDRTKASSDRPVGASSDMLAPVAWLSFAYESVALHGQSRFLADQWELGLWNDLEETQKVRVGENLIPSRSILPNMTLDESLHPLSPPRLSNRHHFSSLSLSSSTIPGSKPIPSVRELSHDLDKSEDRGLLSGEYSTGSSLRDTKRMVSLKKWFTQHDSGLNRAHMPDSSLVSGTQRVVPESDRYSFEETKSSREKHTSVCVYVRVAEDRTPYPDNLSRMVDICEKNAEIALTVNEKQKSDVWRHLSQMIKKQLVQRPGNFDGWGGASGGALGVDMVQNLLSYYERVGDVQMLSTIVCVLSQCNQRDFLPTGNQAKYDMYIRCYSRLLFCWGLLSKRAELRKHLSNLLPGDIDSGSTMAEKDERPPGIVLQFDCPDCGSSSDHGRNYCLVCRTFPFRCALCEDAVRGLFTLCDSCGHGGHVNHLRSWFKDNACCPTGCGCKCTSLRQSSVEQETSVSQYRQD